MTTQQNKETIAKIGKTEYGKDIWCTHDQHFFFKNNLYDDPYLKYFRCDGSCKNWKNTRKIPEEIWLILPFRKMMAQTAVVMRSYNNSHIVKKVREAIGESFGSIIVVCKNDADNGNTRAWLEEAGCLKEQNVHLIEMNKGYSWCNALNSALFQIQTENLFRRQKQLPEINYVLNLSVEANITRQNFYHMVDYMLRDDCGVVGTTFDGRINGNSVETGWTYNTHARNTCALWRLVALQHSLGGFDPICDRFGGMEDFDAIIRMTLLTQYSAHMADANVKLILGKNFHQPTKEAREREAVALIVARWRSLFEEGSEERKTVENIVSQMGLEK